VPDTAIKMLVEILCKKYIQCVLTDVSCKRQL